MKEIKQVKKKKKEKRSLIGQIILAILIIIILLLSFRCGRSDTPTTAEYEKNVNAITEIDYSERQEAIDAIVEEGKMNVNYSPKAVFEGKTSVLFNVKNIKNNHAPIRFEIYDENDRCIYTSKQIEPGYEMNRVELETELEQGVHECSIKIGYAEEGNVSSVFPISIEVRE
jgi:hypothetical protein